MAKLTVNNDMKLSSALDQLEDALESAYASLKMVHWAQLNIARFAGGVIDPSLNHQIKSVPLEIEDLWKLVHANHNSNMADKDSVYSFIDDHNKKILDIIDDFEATEK